MVIAGGTGTNDGGALKALSDVHAMDLSSPHLEVMDRGSWGVNTPWLKPVRIGHTVLV